VLLQGIQAPGRQAAQAWPGSGAELEGIARLLAGKCAVMNLIPYNSVEGARALGMAAGS